MNARLAHRGWLDVDARRALAVLGAAAGPLPRYAAAALYLVFLAGGVLIWQLARVPEKGANGIVLLGAIGAALLWAIWLARVAAVQVAGRGLRLPRIDADVIWALGFAFVLTVLAPAGLASWAGVDPRIAYGGMMVGALAGTLLMLLPGIVVVGALTVIGWTVLVVVAVPLDWPDFAWPKVDLELFQRLPWAALALALAVVGCWQATLRDRDGSNRLMWRSAVLNFATADAESGNDQVVRAQVPDWLWPTGQIEPGGPARPVRAMGAWLGTPFAPLSRAQLAVQLGAAGAIVTLIVAYQLRGGSLSLLSSLLVGAALVGGVIPIVLQYGLRLDAIRWQRSAEWSELALLPGWVDAATARTLLLRAVFTPIATLSAGLLLVLLALAVSNGVDAIGVGLLVLAVLAVALASAVICLRALAGQRLDPAGMVGCCLAGIGLPVLSVYAGLSNLRGYLDGLGGLALGSAWVLALAFLSITGYRAWCRFQALPHAFVEPAAIAATSTRGGSAITPSRLLAWAAFALGVGVAIGWAFAVFGPD